MNKTITVHSPNIQLMKEFITKFKKVLTKLKIDASKFDNIKIQYEKTTRDIYDGCDWLDMPEFIVNDAVSTCPYFKLVYKKTFLEFIEALSKEIGIKITKDTQYIWYPERCAELSPYKGKIFVSDKIINKYPIYIISKGRWESRMTSKYLESIDLDYKIVVEPQEFENYKKYIDVKKILILPDEYLNKNQGGIPARNFVLKHSRDNKDKRHWILDDNIDGFYRLNESSRIKIKSGAVFRTIEDYVDRYTNIKMAGHNYVKFAVSTNINIKPITFNTRIYSSILLDNSIGYEWRGKYNEDTDLSLRILKDGYPTALFNCFLANKMTTLKMKGGNTDTIYNTEDALYLKAKSLYDQHPDIVKIKTKFNRTHHEVNYNVFKNNKPIMIENLKLKDKTNNYTIKLQEIV